MAEAFWETAEQARWWAGRLMGSILTVHSSLFLGGKGLGSGARFSHLFRFFLLGIHGVRWLEQVWVAPCNWGGGFVCIYSTSSWHGRCYGNHLIVTSSLQTLEFLR